MSDTFHGSAKPEPGDVRSATETFLFQPAGDADQMTKAIEDHYTLLMQSHLDLAAEAQTRLDAEVAVLYGGGQINHDEVNRLIAELEYHETTAEMHRLRASGYGTL